MLIKSQRIKSGIRNHKVPTLNSSGATGVDLQGEIDENSFNEPEDYIKQLQMLKSELKNAKDTSYRNGLSAGEKAGFQQGVGLIQKEIEKFASLTESIKNQQEELIASSEHFVISFALKVVEKIVGGKEFSTLKLDKDKLQEVVAESLKLFSDSTKYTLRVRKETGEVVEKYKSEILKEIERPIEISIIDDPTLSLRDCLVECDYGVLDAKLESQLEEIKSFLIE